MLRSVGTWKPNSSAFPLLDSEGWRETSPNDPRYNCIAWAAGESHRAWWPSPSDLIYWPDEGGQPTLEVFQRAFARLGYEVCQSSVFERRFDKVAIYVLGGEVKHMARQLPDGSWSSKLGAGDSPDIAHTTLAGLEGPLYGKAVCFMRKRSDGPASSLRPAFFALWAARLRAFAQRIASRLRSSTVPLVPVRAGASSSSSMSATGRFQAASHRGLRYRPQHRRTGLASNPISLSGSATLPFGKRVRPGEPVAPPGAEEDRQPNHHLDRSSDERPGDGLL